MISYIHSSTVLVSDQDRAIDFFVNKLGWEKRDDNPFGENSRWIVVAPPGKETGLALLKPEDMGHTGESAGGHTGVSVVASDVQRTYEELTSRGVEFTEPPQQMPWGSMATWFKDPDGNTYFLSQEEA